jgi:hypothetical protein
MERSRISPIGGGVSVSWVFLLLSIPSCIRGPVRPFQPEAQPFSIPLQLGMWWDYARVTEWPYQPGDELLGSVRLEVQEGRFPPSELIELDEVADFGDVFALWEEEADLHIEVPPHYLLPQAVAHSCITKRYYMLYVREDVEGYNWGQYLRIDRYQRGATPVARPTKSSSRRLLRRPGAWIRGMVYCVVPVGGTERHGFSPCWLANSNLGLLDLTLAVVEYPIDRFPYKYREQERITSLLRIQNSYEHGHRLHERGARIVVPGLDYGFVGWASPTCGWTVSDRETDTVTPVGTFRCIELTRFGEGYHDPLTGAPLFQELWSDRVGLVARIDLRRKGDGMWEEGDGIWVLTGSGTRGASARQR